MNFIKNNLIIFFLFFFILFLFIEAKIYDKFLFIDEIIILNDSMNLFFLKKTELFYPHRILSIILLKILMDVFKDIYIVRIFGIFFSTASVFVFYKILRLKFNETESFLGSVLFSSFPLFLGMGPTVLTDIAGLFWSILGFYFYLNYKKNNFLKNFFLSSIVFSVGMLFKEMVAMAVAAISLNLLINRQFKKIIVFNLLFISIPLIYFLIFFILTKKMVWIDFYIFNAQSFKWRRLISGEYLKLILFYGNIIFFWGTFSLIKFYKKKDEMYSIFLFYFSMNILLFLVWPELANRHFIFFLPSLIYFIVSFSKDKFNENGKYIFILVSFLNYVLSIVFLLYFLQPYKPLIETIEWIEENVKENDIIYTDNYLIEFFLKHNNYNISKNENEANLFILEKNENFVPETKLIKEFENKCLLSYIRTLKCDIMKIKILKLEKSKF